MTAEFIAPSVCKVFNIKQVNFRKDGNDLQLCLSVSVFTVLSKFLECYMYGIITNHLQTFHPLAESQWRFLPGKSTVTGLLTTTHNWLSILQGGGEIGAFSFKLRKAVDSTPHEVLLKKIKGLEWVTQYFLESLTILFVGNRKLWLMVQNLSTQLCCQEYCRGQFWARYSL